MHLRKYQALDSEEAEEGFEQNPTISEEIVLQSNHHRGTFYSFNSILTQHKHKKARYLSQEKPQFKLKALEQTTRYLKKTNFKHEGLPCEDLAQSDEDNRLELIGARKKKKLQNNKSIPNFEEALEAAIIKTKNQIAENIVNTSNPQQRESNIKETISLSPNAELIYKQKVSDSTFTYFKRLIKNNHQSTFLNSKYNAVLKSKMQREKLLKYEIASQRPSKADCIEFSGDFESGNLDYALKIGQDEYNIYLRIDTNTRGHQSWFYFKVSNHYSSLKKIRINICNIKRKFKMIENGQKIHIKALDSHADWQTLKEDIEMQPFGKNLFKITFAISLQPHKEVLVSLIPPYTYSQLLKDLQECEGAPNIRVDVLTHTITGLAIPLVTISKGAARQRKNKPQGKLKKKLILISGRIHPSETCSSYIIRGIIKQLLQQQQCYQQFLAHTVIKIIPMLNPDGVVFGNFRTNYLGDDLNRSFHRTDDAAYPEIMALKQLGKKFQSQYGQNFVGFLDLHGHSNQPNSFVYGPEYEQKSQSFLECRILPKILDRMSKYFKYDMSEFRLQEYKYNTARGYFLKKLRVPAYTIQTSYALYVDKHAEDKTPRSMAIPEWTEYGRQIASSLLSYHKYLQILKSNLTITKKSRENYSSFSFIKKDKGHLSSFDFSVLKKEIEKETAKDTKTKRDETGGSDSDGQSIGEDLTEVEKEIIFKKIKQVKVPSFLLPKVPKPSLALPAVVPSILRIESGAHHISTIPRLVNKYRQKKLVRPMNLSYQYTQYLLKNISDIGSLRPEVLQFNYSRKKANQTQIKKQAVINL